MSSPVSWSPDEATPSSFSPVPARPLCTSPSTLLALLAPPPFAVGGASQHKNKRFVQHWLNFTLPGRVLRLLYSQPTPATTTASCLPACPPTALSVLAVQVVVGAGWGRAVHLSWHWARRPTTIASSTISPARTAHPTHLLLQLFPTQTLTFDIVPSLFAICHELALLLLLVIVILHDDVLRAEFCCQYRAKGRRRN